MHTRAVQHGMPWATGGYDVLYWQGVQWRKLCIPPMWVQQGIHLIWGMYVELLLQIWENLVWVLQSNIPRIWV